MILGNDVEVICGEWETGDKPYPTSGEDYNIVLQIDSIVRHPGKFQYQIFNIVESTRKCHKRMKLRHIVRILNNEPSLLH